MLYTVFETACRAEKRKGMRTLKRLGKLYEAIFSTEAGAIAVSALIMLSLPVMLYVLPRHSHAAARRLHRLRDEHVARQMQDISSQADVRLASRLIAHALLMYAAFWLLASCFLAFGVGAYAVLAIPIHTLSFVATRSVSTTWRELDLSPSRFRLIYLALYLITLFPGLVLFFMRYLA